MQSTWETKVYGFVIRINYTFIILLILSRASFITLLLISNTQIQILKKEKKYIRNFISLLFSLLANVTILFLLLLLGTAVAQWLRCCVTNRKVAGSIPAGVSGFFIELDPSNRTVVLGSTQPLTEMITRSIS